MVDINDKLLNKSVNYHEWIKFKINLSNNKANEAKDSEVDMD